MHVPSASGGTDAEKDQFIAKVKATNLTPGLQTIYNIADSTSSMTVLKQLDGIMRQLNTLFPTSTVHSVTIHSETDATNHITPSLSSFDEFASAMEINA
jgi:hypothetical protein